MQTFSAADLEALRHAKELILRGDERLAHGMFAMFNWVLATVFAANGGALIAILSSEPLRTNTPKIAIGAFAVGVLLIIGSGLWSLVQTFWFAKKIGTVISTLTLAITGHGNLDNLKIELDAARMRWWHFGPTVRAILSYGTLFFGVVKIWWLSSI